MDFGGGGSVKLMDSLAASVQSSEASGQRGGMFESGFHKHGRSSEAEEHEWRWRSLKMARNDVKTAPFFSDGEQMLSFSSASKQGAALMMPAGDGTLLPYYSHHTSASPWNNAGNYTTGSCNMNMHGVLARVRGPFTPSQWLELEHQALIYKYIVSDAHIPTSLLIPIRRSLSIPGFNPYTAASFGSSALGWGSFHLGYSRNADPEPGRCRRTDGKKWRCSRDAVADQKYCERHMNRGRHRSRKHVEGHNGHAAKPMPIITSSQSASAVSGGGSSSSLSTVLQQANDMLPYAINPCTAQFSRTMMNKEDLNEHGQEFETISMLTSVNPKLTSTFFPVSKKHNPFKSSSYQAKFGLVSSDLLLNPQSSSSGNVSFACHQKFSDQQHQTHSLHHFIDDWSEQQSDCSRITWPEVDEMHSNRTQFSISMPVAYSDLSNTSSPNHEKVTLLPKFSRECDPVSTGLRVGTMKEFNQHKGSWIPISWEASMAGPLGEVLNNTNNTSKDQSNNCSASSLNLLTDHWDSSPRLESSPTGVLQKTSFDSLSSSTRSSPRTENHKTRESTSSL